MQIGPYLHPLDSDVRRMASEDSLQYFIERSRSLIAFPRRVHSVRRTDDPDEAVAGQMPAVFHRIDNLLEALEDRALRGERHVLLEERNHSFVSGSFGSRSRIR